jgi:hypothetical protein
MSGSFVVVRFRRLLPIVALVGSWVLFAPDSTVDAAGNFHPSAGVVLSNSAHDANADTTITIDFPANDKVWSQLVLFNPPGTDLIAPGPGHPSFSSATDPALGDIVGDVTMLSSLGLTNGLCNVSLSIPFTLMNGTVNMSDTIAALSQAAVPSGSSGFLGPMLQDGGSVAGLPAHVEHYPDFLNTMLDPDGVGTSPQPLARYSAGLIVAAQAWTLELVVFDPGAFTAYSSPESLSDLATPVLGYPTVIILNDDVDAPSPSAHSDFCSPQNLTIQLHGISKTNPCNGNSLPPCNTLSGINSPNPGVPTTLSRYKNPATAGTHYWHTWVKSLRDVDGDTLENQYDTCPFFTVTSGWSQGNFSPANDADGDLIPGGGPGGGCDPTPAVNNGSHNHDADTSANADSWQNAADNCPLIVNGTQAESELSQPAIIAAPDGGPKRDGIGDACEDPESICTGTVDNDADGLVNDGCAPVGPPETACQGSADEDNDGSANDGCPDSDLVANGHYHTHFSFTAITITSTATDTDDDGFSDSDEAAKGSCASNPCPATYSGAGCPNCAGMSIPEHLTLFRPFPVAHSGSGGTTANPGLAANPASLSNVGEPYQICNDGEDNDLDGEIDFLELDGPDAGTLTDCNPASVTFSHDEDGDGFTSEDEIFIGTDAHGRCEPGDPNIAIPSTRWPADLAEGSFSMDKVNIQDLSRFITPIKKFNTFPGLPSWDPRFDVVPGTTFAQNFINIADLAKVASFVPPMFGVKAFGGPTCTGHPDYGD